MADQPMIRLRDLPGVSAITDLCRNPRNFEYPTSAHTQEKIDNVSVSLFGIAVYSTQFEHRRYVEEDVDDAEDGDVDQDEEDSDVGDVDTEEEYQEAMAQWQVDRDAWEQPYSATKLSWPQSRPFWEAIGWDISDGKGSELPSAHCFERQIIAVAGKLVPYAAFTPDGSGRWDDEEDEQAMMEDRLKAQAEAFLERRGKRL